MQTEEEKAGQQRLFNTGAVITSSPLVSWLPLFFCVLQIRQYPNLPTEKGLCC